jgi:hypothetical protein
MTNAAGTASETRETACQATTRAARVRYNPPWAGSSMVEQQTLNLLVAGSSPARLTNSEPKIPLLDRQEGYLVSGESRGLLPGRGQERRGLAGDRALLGRLGRGRARVDPSCNPGAARLLEENDPSPGSGEGSLRTAVRRSKSAPANSDCAPARALSKARAGERSWGASCRWPCRGTSACRRCSRCPS